MHPVVALPLLEVPSAEKPTPDCPMANHLNASAGSSAISVDYFCPLPVTPRGNTYILLITDRFSRLADMFAVTAAEITAEYGQHSGQLIYSPMGVPTHHILGQRPPVLL